MNQTNYELINQQIQNLRSIDLSKIEFEELKKAVRPILFAGYTVAAPNYQGLELFRGKVVSAKRLLPTGFAVENLPKTKSDLLYPPAHLVTKFQRANRPGNPMFYCSRAPGVLFAELQVSDGDFLVISKWRTTNPLTVMRIGYEPEVFSYLGSERPCPNPGKSLPGFEERIKGEDFKLARSFFASEFTKRVTPGNEHLYKLSAAIAEIMRGHVGEGAWEPQTEVEHVEFQGIQYPSIAAGGNVDNLALVPKFADDSLKFVTCELIFVGGNGNQNLLQDVAHEIIDGKIIWTRQARKSTILRHVEQ